ncbi:hypothetical protein ACT4VF_10685 [Acinetobacter baumannii]
MNTSNNHLFNESDINGLYLFKNTAPLVNSIHYQFIEKNFNLYRQEVRGVDGDLQSSNAIDLQYLFDSIKQNIIAIDKEVFNSNYNDEDKIRFRDFIHLTNSDLVHFYEEMVISKYYQADAFLNLISIFYKLFSRISGFLKFTTVNPKLFNDFLKLKDDFDVSKRSNFDNTSDYINNKIIIFENKINELENKSIINSDLFNKAKIDFFTKQKIEYDKNFIDTLNSFRQELNSIYTEYTNELVLKVGDLKNSVKNSKAEVDNLDNAIHSYKSAVSTKIQNEISKHYQKKATMEMRTYWGATLFSILLILGSLGLLAWGLIDYYYDYISTSSCLTNEDFKSCVTRLETIRDITKNIGISFFVMRFVFSLLLFLTVIYTSRIASRAYSHWRHSENMHLKLSSLEPFITELPKEVRHEIHRDLIPDYFGKDAGLVDTANEKFKDLPANVSAVAMKAIEQISGSGSSSSTEKNNKKPDGGTE